MTDDRKTYFNRNQAQNQEGPIGVLDEVEVTVGPDGREEIKKIIQYKQDPRTGRFIRCITNYKGELICPNPLGLHEIYRRIETKEAKPVGDHIVCPQCRNANRWRKLLNLFLSWICEWKTF